MQTLLNDIKDVNRAFWVEENVAGIADTKLFFAAGNGKAVNENLSIELGETVYLLIGLIHKPELLFIGKSKDDGIDDFYSFFERNFLILRDCEFEEVEFAFRREGLRLEFFSIAFFIGGQQGKLDVLKGVGMFLKKDGVFLFGKMRGVFKFLQIAQGLFPVRIAFEFNCFFVIFGHFNSSS